MTVSNPAPIDTVSVFYTENGKLTDIAAKKLEGPEKWPPGVWQGGKDWDGIEDRYFAAGPVTFEYVGLDMNLLAGGVEGLDQRRHNLARLAHGTS